METLNYLPAEYDHNSKPELCLLGLVGDLDGIKETQETVNWMHEIGITPNGDEFSVSEAQLARELEKLNSYIESARYWVAEAQKHHTLTPELIRIVSTHADILGDIKLID